MQSSNLPTNCYQLQMNRDMLSRVSEHIHRAGYQFRESIVDEAIDALQALGETVITTWNGTGVIEPIPKTQDEINKQADGALRDLFPRIPNTDRQMIIDHAFQKVGAPPTLVPLLISLGDPFPRRASCRFITRTSSLPSSPACSSCPYQT